MFPVIWKCVYISARPGDVRCVEERDLARIPNVGLPLVVSTFPDVEVQQRLKEEPPTSMNEFFEADGRCTISGVYVLQGCVRFI